MTSNTGVLKLELIRIEDMVKADKRLELVIKRETVGLNMENILAITTDCASIILAMDKKIGISIRAPNGRFSNSKSS